MAGAPEGNQNAAKAKQWSAAIERALDRLGDPTINPDVPHERSPRMKAYDRLADSFILKVAESDLGFFKEFGDRMEGKSAQSMTLAGDPEKPLIQRIERTIIDSTKPPDT